METSHTETMVIIIITIVAYMFLMIGIGIYCSKKNNDVGDFYLGGRKLGPIVTAMSAEASDMSSYLLMGLPGLAYLCGVAEVSWTVIGLAVGTYLNWLLVAKRLRVYSQSCGAITIPDFFSNRYRDNKRILVGVAAVIILVFFIPYTASGFSACGKLFGTLFGLDYHVAMLISAAIIILYTSIGGFLAASTTDLIQSIVMTIALIILVIFGVASAGGIDNVIENAKGLSGFLDMFALHNPAENTSTEFSFFKIVSTLAWGLGYFGMPHILLRFMAIKDKNKIKISRRIASIWVVISMGIAVIIGLIGNALTAQGSVEKLTDSATSETIVIKLANLLSENGWLAAIFAGLIFAGILACTMSTADSQLLAASSSVSENIIKGVFKVRMSDKTSMLVARIVLIVIAVIAAIIAWDPNSSVFRVVSFAWAGFGATFGPVVLLALFWRRSNKWGALAALIAGGVMVFLWKFVISTLGGVFAVYELLPAFIIALVADVVVSLLTKKPEQEILDEFDAVKAELKGVKKRHNL